MAHFAELDAGNTVLRVIVVSNDDTMDDGVESEAKGIAFCQSLFPGTTWVQTSYNARIRKNYAGPGYKYDAERDAFIPPKPFPSWILNEDDCNWYSPVPHPGDGAFYVWNEESGAWELPQP